MTSDSPDEFTAMLRALPSLPLPPTPTKNGVVKLAFTNTVWYLADTQGDAVRYASPKRRIVTRAELWAVADELGRMPIDERRERFLELLEVKGTFPDCEIQSIEKSRRRDNSAVIDLSPEPACSA